MKLNINRKVYPSKLILVYYLLLLILLVSWKSTSSAPNILFRTTYLFLFLLPLYKKYIEWFPVFLSGFYIISRYGYNYSYLPTELYIYTIIVFIGVLLYKPNYIIKFKEANIIIKLLLYVSFIDLINNGKLENITYSLLIIVMFFMFSDKNRNNTLPNLSIAFVVATFVLSIMFLLNRNMFVETYSYDSGLERYGWTDPNYFASILGIGTILSVSELSKDKIFLYKILLFLTILISLAVILLTGSRGGIFSVAIGLSVFIFFSKLNFKFKLSIIIFFAIALFYLYNNDYFNLLLYRIENDSGGGSGRFDIWKLKLSLFYEEGNIFRWFFGYGYEKGFSLGALQIHNSFDRPYIGFHNDFIAYLVDYGIIGLVMFIYFLIYPIIKLGRKNIPIVFTGIVYLASCSLTLEPLNYGHLALFIFYIYIYTISMYFSSMKKNNSQ